MKLGKEMKEKWPELATRKGVIFYQDNARPHIFGHLQKIIGVRPGRDASSTFHSIVLTLHHSINIYSVHFKTIRMEKHSIQMRLSKMS